jgi:hypothetical protein
MRQERSSKELVVLPPADTKYMVLSIKHDKIDMRPKEKHHWWWQKPYTSGRRVGRRNVGSSCHIVLMVSGKCPHSPAPLDLVCECIGPLSNKKLVATGEIRGLEAGSVTLSP